jgi:CheY-like chemotaxis protein
VLIGGRTSSFLLMAALMAPEDTDAVHPIALVVDDHRTVRRMARLLLTAAGFCEVGKAADAAAAIAAAAVAAIRRSSPAFVLLDVLLPDGSGIDVADQVAGPGAPVVLLTSSRSAGELGPALSSRAFDQVRADRGTAAGAGRR